MSQQQWLWQSDRQISSDTAAGQRVLKEVLGQLKAFRWGVHDVFAVHLAMEEALANAIKHGNRLDASKHIQIRCQISSDLVRIQITDEGAGFDPAALPDPTDPARLDSPGGRGVMLIRAFMSHVEHNASGNAVLLEKERTHRG